MNSGGARDEDLEPGGLICFARYSAGAPGFFPYIRHCNGALLNKLAV